MDDLDFVGLTIPPDDIIVMQMEGTRSKRVSKLTPEHVHPPNKPCQSCMTCNGKNPEGLQEGFPSLIASLGAVTVTNDNGKSVTFTSDGNTFLNNQDLPIPDQQEEMLDLLTELSEGSSRKSRPTSSTPMSTRSRAKSPPRSPSPTRSTRGRPPSPTRSTTKGRTTTGKPTPRSRTPSPPRSSSPSRSRGRSASRQATPATSSIRPTPVR